MVVQIGGQTEENPGQQKDYIDLMPTVNGEKDTGVTPVVFSGG